jgi:hypothetical protein
VVSGALIRSAGGVVSNYAAAHLALRGYRGLDAAIGQTPVGTIEQGRRGIAANYATLGAPADRAALGGTAAVDAGLAHVAARGSESASASGATAVSAVASNVEILRAKVRVVDPDPARASAAEVAGAESDTDPQASPSAVVEFLEFLDDVG